MKKILALILALAMVFALAACGNNEDTESTDDVINVSSETDNEDTASEDEESSESVDSDDEESNEPTSSKDKASSKPTSSKNKVSSDPTSSKDKVSSKPASSKEEESSKPTSSKDKASSKPTSSKDKTSSKPTSSKDNTSSKPTSSKDKASSKPTSSEEEVCKHKNVEVTPAKEATCEVEGNTQGKTCKDCGVVLLKSEIIPKADHDFKPATTTKPKTCRDCGATEGGVAAPEAPEAVIDNTFPIMQNGAEITFSVKNIEYTDETYTKCIITYTVSIKNGSFATKHAWSLNVGHGDVGGTVGGGKITDETPTLEPGQEYVADFKTTPVDAVGHMGYRLTFS